jgi:hypothetical protein
LKNWNLSIVSIFVRHECTEFPAFSLELGIRILEEFARRLSIHKKVQFSLK